MTAATRLAGRTVLVADDTAFVRDRFKAAIESAGHNAVTVQTGQELLAQVRANTARIDLIVLDLVLNRAETPLMREVAARDGTVANGQGSFLVAQAAAFTLWTGAEAPTEVMRAALAAHLGLPEEGLAVVGD